MYKTILTIIAIVISIIVFILYSYIALRLIPTYPEKRKRLGWTATAITSVAVFGLLLTTQLWDSRLNVFTPVFIIFSLLLGLLFRESAISPFHLADWWKKIGQHKNN
jgi:prepilin signal peptidase PulO-like enzyme (type II secretory pathway)